MSSIYPYTLSYEQIEKLVQEMQPFLLSATCIRCDCDQNGKQIYFLYEKENRRKTLFFSFLPSLLSFHFLQKTPKKCKPLPFSSIICDSSLIKIEIINKDRILGFTFLTKTGEKKFIAEFFSKHPNYYWIDKEQKIEYSLYPIKKSLYTPPSFSSFCTLESVSLLSHAEREKAHTQQVVIQEMQVLFSFFHKQLQSFIRRMHILGKQLIACQDWKKIYHEAELIKANFSLYPKGQKEWQVFDWETSAMHSIPLNFLETAQEAVKNRFKKAKKLQLGCVPLQNQKTLLEEKIKLCEQNLAQLEGIHTLLEIENLKEKWKINTKEEKSTNSKKVAPKVYREFYSKNQTSIWVGKNSKANDVLTFKLAKGNDWWLHVRNEAGSHVLIRQKDSQYPDSDTLQDAMQLALHFSKAKSEAEICLTQRKYLSKPKNKSKSKHGQVQLSKHKVLFVIQDPARYQAILDRHSSSLNR